MKTVKVLLIEVGREPVVFDLEDSLQGIYKALDCDYFQMFNVGGGYFVCLDDNGLINNKPQNGCGFLGNYFFTKVDDEGNFATFNEHDIQACYNYWKTYRHVQHAGPSNWSIQMFENFDEMVDELNKHRRQRNQDFMDSQGEQ